jgi:MFS family permease
MKQTTNKWGWLSVLTAALFFFYWFIQLSLNNTLHDFYIQRFDLTGYFGLFTSMYLIGNVIMFIPAGMLLDRFPTKHVLVVNILVMILGATGLWLSYSTLLAFGCMLVVGLAGAFSLLAVLRVATSWFSPNYAGFPMSLAITLGMCGGLFGNSIGKLLLDQLGSGQAVQISNIILGMVVLLLVLIGIKEPPRQQDHPKQTSSSVNTLEALTLVLKNPQNWLAGLYISLLNFPIMILDFAFGQAYLVHVFNVNEINAANIAAIIFIGFIVTGPIVGKWSDYWGYRRPLMLIGASSALVVMLLLYIDNLPTAALYVIFLFIGIVSSAQNIGYPVIAESNDPSVAATANSLGSILIMGGGAVAQNVFGSLKHVAGFEFAYHMLPVSMVIALVIALMIKETGWRSRYQPQQL